MLHQARMLKRSVARCQFGLAAVLCDDEGIRRESRTPTSAAEKVERAAVFRFGLVRRIEIHEIDQLRDLAEALQHRAYASVLQRKASNNLQSRKILPNRRQRRLSVFGKPDVRRASAQRLDSNSSSARVEIDKATAANTRRDDIEESLAQAVAGRPGLETTWSNKLTGTVSTCNNAHLWMV